jgi:hypothetical protein
VRSFTHLCGFTVADPLFLHFTVKELRAAVCSVSRILLQLERMEEIEVRLYMYTS